MRTARRNIVGGLVIAVVVLAPFVMRAAEAYWCTDNSGCLCIPWSTQTGAGIEIRCRTSVGTPGWASGPGQPGDGGAGTWGGSGGTRNPATPLPGNPIPPDLVNPVDRAMRTAREKMRGERIDKGQWEPTRCGDLLANNPMGMSAMQMLAYIVVRDGAGVKDGSNIDVCAAGGVSAWTKCCEHDPVVYVCSSVFRGLTADVQARKLIHEALHVAGQREDKNGSVGSGDPPNTNQIDEIVRKACGL